MPRTSGAAHHPFNNAMQAGQPGTAAFARADGEGRSGSAGMRPQPSHMDEVWSSVDISDDMLRVAAEAVVGRLDIEELLGDTLPKYIADEASACLLQHVLDFLPGLQAHVHNNQACGSEQA